MYKNKNDDWFNNLAFQYFEAIQEWTIVSKTDIDWNITYANEKFCEISGYTREELIWNSHNMVRHPEMSDEFFADMWDTIKNKKQPFWWTIKNQKKNWWYYWVKAMVKPILDENWNILEFISLRQDITKEKDFEEKIKRQYDFITYAFNKYVSQNLIEKIISENKLPTDFEKRNLTVMFVDMEDYTFLTDKFGTKKVVELSSLFFKYIVKYVQKYWGSVDKYIWDNVMCVRNWFEENEFHSQNACKAALEIIGNISEFKNEVKKILLDDVNIRIWISSWDCLVWNIWTDVKFDYTVIGWPVNLASRLEWANKRFWTNILIDYFCYENIKNSLQADFIGNIKIRWFHKKVDVYSL